METSMSDDRGTRGQDKLRERLHRYCGEWVYDFASARLGDPGEAEAAARAVLEICLERLDDWRGEPALALWVFGIARKEVRRRAERRPV